MIPDATANAMLDAITVDRVSLHTAYSSTGANEVTGGSPAYARQTVTFAAASGRSRALSADATFDVPATTVQFIGRWTNAGAVFRGMEAAAGAGFSESDYQVDVTNNRILAEGHALVNTNNVAFYGGTPPTGLTEGTVYFVVGVTASDPDYFQVALTSGGAAIDITGNGSGQCKFCKVVPEVFAAQGQYKVLAGHSFGLTE
jgi:hypothetical protein